jgi:hypothetical protein
VAEYTNSYRLFPSQNGYKDIIVGFYGEDEEKVGYEFVRLGCPDGKKKTLGKKEIEAIKPVRNESGDETRSISIEEFAANQPHVDVEIRFLQKGQDHWIQVGYQAMQPTDGFRFTIHCEEPMEIMEEATFIFGAEYSKEPPRVKHTGRAEIVCNQWIDQGSGVTLVVAVPHKIDPAILDALASRTHEARRRLEQRDRSNGEFDGDDNSESRLNVVSEKVCASGVVLDEKAVREGSTEEPATDSEARLT